MEQDEKRGQGQKRGICKFALCPECRECCLLPVTNGVRCRYEEELSGGEKDEG